MRGWALAAQGYSQEGISQIQEGRAAFHGTGAEVARPVFLALLAEVYGKDGQAPAGLACLTEALDVVAKHREHFYEAELNRLKGELILAQSTYQTTEAEACFHQALNIARRQQAKSWELRAATSLARLWQQQGKRGEAYELLAPIYGWFTEGFDTADLHEAQALLDALA
jgi:predicted ATPase